MFGKYKIKDAYLSYLKSMEVGEVAIVEQAKWEALNDISFYAWPNREDAKLDEVTVAIFTVKRIKK